MGLIFDKNIAEFYDSWYHSTQGKAIAGSIEQLIVAVLNPRPEERVLDIGCGTGNHLLMLSKMGMDVSGVDASPYMIDRARERLGHGCSLKMGVAEDLPYDDNEFDLAVFINTLEFLDNPLAALREAGRVANKKVFIGVLNSFSWNGLLKRAQGCLGDPLFGHARLFNLWQMRSLLEMAYGQVPISWGSIRIRSIYDEEKTPFTFIKQFLNRKHSLFGHSPFAYFLGFSAEMAYHIKTDNLPLKIRLKNAGQSLVGAKTIEDLNCSKRVDKDERGLPV
ncbi:MAG: methyltransferase domain-containing protein [Thermodesulfobacteriota bacterium]|nr:methyltransferase domain-containing protein [Thermodesulfobacteriota bacterium]